MLVTLVVAVIVALETAVEVAVLTNEADPVVVPVVLAVLLAVVDPVLDTELVTVEPAVVVAELEPVLESVVLSDTVAVDVTDALAVDVWVEDGDVTTQSRNVPFDRRSIAAFSAATIGPHELVETNIWSLGRIMVPSAAPPKRPRFSLRGGGPHL